MSEVFEGLVCRIPEAHLRKALASVPSALAFKTASVDGYSVANRVAARDESFSEEIDEIARDLSKTVRQVVVYSYDSRVGHRRSVVFELGKATASFSEDDELWVALDEKGRPVIGSPKLRVFELQPGEEYETAMNAIDLGLDALARNELRWEDLHEVLSELA